MDMWTVITPAGHIVAQSRLFEVAVTYVAPGLLLLRNGVPVELELAG